MIASIIRWSITNRFFVLLSTAIIVGLGIYSLKRTPVDAIPDLSDVQVIIKTSYAGQAPQVVQDQVTYPLTTAMLSVPGAVTVRGYSFSATPMCMSFSMKIQIYIGHVVVYWNTLARRRQPCPNLQTSAWPRCHRCWLGIHLLSDRSDGQA